MHAVLWLSLHTETETEQQLSVGTVHLALDLCLQIVPKWVKVKTAYGTLYFMF